MSAIINPSAKQYLGYVWYQGRANKSWVRLWPREYNHHLSASDPAVHYGGEVDPLRATAYPTFAKAKEALDAYVAVLSKDGMSLSYRVSAPPILGLSRVVTFPTALALYKIYLRDIPTED